MLENYRDIASKRNYLFVASSYALQVLDVTDPIAPQLVQFVPLANLSQEVEVEGDYLYVSMFRGMAVFHINLPPVDCGDANADGMVNAGDVVYIINYIFKEGQPPDPLESADANCDGMVNAGDAVYLINYIFKGGSAPCDHDGDGQPDC